MKTLTYKFCLFFLVISVCSCKKQEGFGPLTDVRPAIPVTVSNVYDYLPAATVKASKGENKITITLAIPSGSGRTIKEITKVAAAATANYSVIYSSTAVSAAGLYTNTPIAGSGTTVTFTTTFDEYKTKTATTTAPASNALLARDFYFYIKLDNDEAIYPQYVRVWVVD